MASIGILGGMGPRATQYFVGELLNEFENAAHPISDQHYPDMFVHFACSNPDRTAAIEADPTGLCKLLREQLDQLEQAGCNFLMMPCITAYAVLGPIGASGALVNVPDLISRRLAMLGPGPFGVLSTRGTRRLLGSKRISFGSTEKLLFLDGSQEEYLMQIIYKDLKSGATTREAAIGGMLSLYEALRASGASHVIAGCTEVEMVLAPDLRCPDGLVCPMRCAAEWIVSQLIERPNEAS